MRSDRGLFLLVIGRLDRLYTADKDPISPVLPHWIRFCNIVAHLHELEC